jgi:hypothetical protein
MGSYLFEGQSSHRWQDCGVFDFSPHGLGMDLRYRCDNGLVGRRVSVRLPIGGAMELTFMGVVRNAKSGPDGIVRAGIEFTSLSEMECSIIDLLQRTSVLRPMG